MRVLTDTARVWLDGGFVPADEATLTIADPALQSGLAVFETLALRSGRLVDPDRHLVRLAHGIERIAAPTPDPDELLAAMRQTASLIDAAHGWLKIVASRSGRLAVFADRVDPELVGRPSTAIILPYRRSRKDPTAGIKVVGYAGFVLGTEEAARRGADDGLWLNDRGHLVEAGSANLFVVDHRRLFTPSEDDGILPGVVRGRVLEVAASMGMKVHPGKVRVPRLQRADEAFLTSSVRGVRPLVQVDGRPIGRGKSGPWTTKIATAVEAARNIEE